METNNDFYDRRPARGKEDDEREAHIQLAELRALKELVSNNDLACHVTISGLSVGLCNNASLLPVINSEIKEVEQFLAGLPNLWE